MGGLKTEVLRFAVSGVESGSGEAAGSNAGGGTTRATLTAAMCTHAHWQAPASQPQGCWVVGVSAGASP